MFGRSETGQSVCKVMTWNLRQHLINRSLHQNSRIAPPHNEKLLSIQEVYETYERMPSCYSESEKWTVVMAG
jgi:hypothetical protein